MNCHGFFWITHRGAPPVVPEDSLCAALTHHLAGLIFLIDQEAVAELGVSSWWASNNAFIR